MQLPGVLEDTENGLPMLVRQLLVSLQAQHDALVEHDDRLTAELAAWLDLVTKQASTGGKDRLLGISYGVTGT
jgi:hypothetical protein